MLFSPFLFLLNGEFFLQKNLTQHFQFVAHWASCKTFARVSTRSPVVLTWSSLGCGTNLVISFLGHQIY